MVVTRARAQWTGLRPRTTPNAPPITKCGTDCVDGPSRSIGERGEWPAALPAGLRSGPEPSGPEPSGPNPAGRDRPYRADTDAFQLAGFDFAKGDVEIGRHVGSLRV